jgi:hypothetical protein
MCDRHSMGWITSLQTRQTRAVDCDSVLRYLALSCWCAIVYCSIPSMSSMMKNEDSGLLEECRWCVD